MYSFGRKFRFSKRKDIQSVFKQSTRSDSQLFRLYREKINDENGKFAVIISKRSGSAIKRNASKRKVKEWLRLNQQYLARHYHHVVYIKKDISNFNYCDFDNQMTQLLIHSKK